jgi:CubicO group peptidase (beta-lactamase class C family)
MADAQSRVQGLIDDLVGRDIERGLQVAAYHEGKLVVDAWSGLADAETRRPVDGDTLFCVFSCGKGVLATAIHLLVERGKVHYDDPVAAYWPKFAANGKGQITIRQILSHTAGIPQMPSGSTVEDMCDWEGMCRKITGLSPLWEPGTRTGYHARSFGYVLGEVARRIDGRAINQLIAEEICRPLGIESMYFGIPDAVEPRVATLEAAAPSLPLPPQPSDSLMHLAIPPHLPASPAVFNRPDVRRACIPSSAGIMNARSLARHYAMLASGGALGAVRILSSERIDLARTLQTEGPDLVIGMPMAKALGYFLGGPQSAMGDRLTAFGHGGSGGSVGFADPEHHFAFALTKTRLVDTAPGEGAAYLVARETRAALGIPE